MLGAEWSGSDYSWQSSTWGDHYIFDCLDPIGLHHVTIEDYGTSVRVLVDSQEIFNLDCDPIPTGTVGLGCGDTEADSLMCSPWYDNLAFTPSGTSLFTTTWGEIKGLLITP